MHPVILSVLQVHALYLITWHHVLSHEVINTLQLHVASFCHHQQAFSAPGYLSSSSHSCHLQGQRLGDFLRLVLQLQEQKKALNKLVIFDSSVATAWHSPTTSYYLSLLPTVTCQIGSSPGYYSMPVRNLIEFFSRIHSSNLHWLAWDQFYKLIWR